MAKAVREDDHSLDPYDLVRSHTPPHDQPDCGSRPATEHDCDGQDPRIPHDHGQAAASEDRCEDATDRYLVQGRVTNCCVA